MGVVFVFHHGGAIGFVVSGLYVVVFALVGDAEYPPLHACGQDA